MNGVASTLLSWKVRQLNILLCSDRCSMHAGIEYQTKQIPVRFFAEQIREGFQIVLTGTVMIYNS